MAEANKNVAGNWKKTHEDQQILAERAELYAKAKVKNPNRWSGQTRNWDKIGSVELNPENKKEAA